MGRDTGTADTADRPQQPGTRRRVVVGSDDSSGARAALAYAFAAAARRHADLDVVTAYPLSLPWAWDATLDAPDVEALRERFRRRAEEIRADGGAGVPDVADVPFRVLIGRGTPGEVLVEASEHADLLVVGSRGRGSVRSALLGSVALHSVLAAHCPVVVVHQDAADDDAAAGGGSAAEPAQAPRVVVGVDGSAESLAALAAALVEAARLGAVVDVVAAYSLADYWNDHTRTTAASVDEIRARVRSGVQALVDAVRRGLPEDRRADLDAVRTVVVEGWPADVLVQRARGAQLLVVGTRGHGALRGLVLGSVALGCVLHAPCPVMVVPAAALPARSAPAPREEHSRV